MNILTMNKKYVFFVSSYYDFFEGMGLTSFAGIGFTNRRKKVVDKNFLKKIFKKIYQNKSA